MSGFSGFVLSCDGHRDRYGCQSTTRGADEQETRAAAEQCGWSRVGERDYCYDCTKKRAARKPLAEVFSGLALREVWDACREAGFTVLDGPPANEPAVLCCGQPVKMRCFLGGAYYAECETCGAAIADVTGPQFSAAGNSVQFIDHDKVDDETAARWTVLSRGAREVPA